MSRDTHRSMAARVWQLAREFFLGENQRTARLLFGALLGLSAAVGVVQVLISYAGRDFITSLAQRDPAGFHRNLWKYLGTFVLAIPVAALYRFITDRLALAWRQWMTHQLVKRFFFNRAYYRLRSTDAVDNPDQRISEDVRFFTAGVLNYFLVIVNSLVTVITFMGVLWTISRTLPIVLVLYAALGTAASVFIGRRLVGLHYHQYQKEADFRYGLVRVRENAESIAFFRGEKREHRDLVKRFGAVVQNMIEIIGWNRNLNFFTNAYTYLALVVPTLIVGPMFMRGQVEFGVVTQAEGAFAQVLAAFSVVIAQFDSLTAFAAGIQRLGALWDSLDEFDVEDANLEKDSQIEVNEGARRLKLVDLTVATPDGTKTLLSGLDFTVPRKSSLLIMGESGSGKSSLLRTIAGIWQSGAGTIERPNLNRMMFLPQKPYMIPGSLRAQLMYPFNEEGADDDKIKEILAFVALDHILKRVEGDLDQVVDWTNVLSIGEQQRVAFARLYMAMPLLAFLDEATSALDEPTEQLLYERLRDSGISYVSVGHRSTLKRYHDLLLEIGKDGTADLSELSEPADDRRRVQVTG